MCQSPLCMSRLWPWVAEIQIQNVQTMLREPFLKLVRVTNNKAQVIGPCILLRHRLFKRKTANVPRALHCDKIAIGIPCRRSDSKVTLSAAYFKTELAALVCKRHLRILFQYAGILYKQLGTGSYPLLAVLFLSHSHCKLSFIR